MRDRPEHLAAELLAAFIALSAVAGGVGLVGGGIVFPPEWLVGTPFASYVGPGLILGLVVGGSALAAALLLLGHHPLALPAAVAAGLIQAGWIVGEVLLVGTHGALMMWLQIVYFTLGALLAALGAHLWRSAPAPTAV